MKVEVCVTSVEAAKIAERAGADRLELCSELAVGGVTPSAGLLQAIRDAVGIPVHVLIRPRSGDFTYSEHTFSQMLRDISYCRELGFDGIVTGCLHADNRLDPIGMGHLAGACADLHLTFHRAFDRIPDWESALLELEAIGVDTILTSGQAASAVQGFSRLEELVQRTGCGIMPGGGIRPSNLEKFIGKGFEAVHLSALEHPEPELFLGVPLNTPGLLREGTPLLPDAGMIETVVRAIKAGRK
ncbi:MAG: copper homeostasis protein CutC [Robiginitalea sp.]|uniref:copper homeostasis protein CutC n=1 Tax=Robiginitalea sp. TaxID=1902411 RepID=UPI003C744FB4